MNTKLEKLCLNLTEDRNQTVSSNTSLFIRLLEWAREEAQTDVHIHKLAENVVKLTAELGTLTMADYDKILEGVMDNGSGDDPGTPEED